MVPLAGPCLRTNRPLGPCSTLAQSPQHNWFLCRGQPVPVRSVLCHVYPSVRPFFMPLAAPHAQPHKSRLSQPPAYPRFFYLLRYAIPHLCRGAAESESPISGFTVTPRPDPLSSPSRQVVASSNLMYSFPFCLILVLIYSDGPRFLILGIRSKKKFMQFGKSYIIW